MDTHTCIDNTVQQNLGHVLSLVFFLTVGLYSLVIKTTETAFFSAVKIRLGSGEFFFLKSELFRCEKVQKGLIRPGRHLRNVFDLQLFSAVNGTHRIPKMCYMSNLGEKRIFAGHFNATFCLNFTIFLKKFPFFKC